MKTLTAKETAKDYLIELFGNDYSIIIGHDENRLAGIIREYARHYCNSKEAKDNFANMSKIEIKANLFSNKVAMINNENRILNSLEVLNTNGTSFIEYWTEKGENDRKMRFEKQASFDIKRRLLTWKNNNYNNAKPTYTDKIKEYLNR